VPREVRDLIRRKSTANGIRLKDDQRRRLAVKGEVLGRKILGEIGASFTPDTILRWHRQLVAEKWDYSDRRTLVGRPRVRPEIVDLVLRMARENPSWGNVRLQGALANLGHKISDATVGNILREHGIEPVPERKRQSTWKEFLEAHWDVLGAIDFTTIEVWTKSGLVTFYLLFVMEVASRRVHFSGGTTSPDESDHDQPLVPPLDRTSAMPRIVSPPPRRAVRPGGRRRSLWEAAVRVTGHFRRHPAHFVRRQVRQFTK
jgi:transposase